MVKEMEKICKCVNIRYSPRVFTGETMNVGVVFHVVEDNRILFKKISKTSRIRAFDDELDLVEFKQSMDYIEDYFKQPTKNTLFESEIQLSKHFLENASRMFLNKYQLSNVITLFSENIENDFENYCKEILYFDYDKEERPTNEQSAKIMNQILYSIIRDKSVEYEKKPIFSETIGEAVVFDYKINQYYFKAFNLSANNYTFKYNNAKVWAYNVSHYFDNTPSNVIFVISKSPETEEERILMKILNETNSKVLTFDQLGEFIESEVTV